jgi:hypothetical protein
LGTYAISPDNRTRFGCVDCDGGGRHGNPLKCPRDVALRIVDALADAHLAITAYAEMSGSGTGWHVWVFLTEPVPAALVRKLLLAVAPRDALLADGKTLADPEAGKGLEIFPKQGEIGPGGYGNMVWLPWWSQERFPANAFHQRDSEGELVPFLPEVLETVALPHLEAAVAHFRPAAGPDPAPQPEPAPKDEPPPTARPTCHRVTRSSGRCGGWPPRAARTVTAGTG